MNEQQVSNLIEALYQSHRLARELGDDDVSGACRNCIAELREIQKERETGRKGHEWVRVSLTPEIASALKRAGGL